MHWKKALAAGAAALAVFVLAGVLYYFLSGPGQEESTTSRTTGEITRAEPQDPADGQKVAQDQSELSREEQTEDKTGEKEQDTEQDRGYLSEGFIHKLARLIFDSYLPVSPVDGTSRLNLSFKMVNMRFATDLSDFDVEQKNILEARQKVMQDLLQPVVIRKLSAFYGARLLDRILYLAENQKKTISEDGRQTERFLTGQETAELFEMLSVASAYTAKVFAKCAADSGIMDLIAEYMQVVDSLQETYFEYWQLEDESGSRRKEELGQRIKELIQSREEKRKNIINRVASQEMIQSGQDYVYQVQWIYRRLEKDGFSKDAIVGLAEAGRLFSVMAGDRAEMILND